MNKRNNDKTLKEAIGQMLDVYRLRQKFDETALIAAWPELMGNAIASRTTQLYISDKKLFVRVESSVIKNELMMMKSQILEKLNDRAGKTVINSLVFL
jgi:predicted nucleic acid-binding Zn ribbon protein